MLCRSHCLFLAVLTAADAFAPRLMTPPTTMLWAEKVEVCGFKDCKRKGGGPRLEKLVRQVLEEDQIPSDQIVVEGCDCQGECGYGPNLVVDGKIVNDVRGAAAVRQALGLPVVDEASS